MGSEIDKTGHQYHNWLMMNMLPYESSLIFDGMSKFNVTLNNQTPFYKSGHDPEKMEHHSHHNYEELRHIKGFRYRTANASLHELLDGRFNMVLFDGEHRKPTRYIES